MSESLNNKSSEQGNVPESVRDLHTEVSTVLGDVKKEIERTISSADINLDVGDENVDKDIREAMMSKVLESQRLAEAANKAGVPSDVATNILKGKEIQWPTIREESLMDWKIIATQVAVDSDYDKKYFRAIMDAHDNYPEDVALINAIHTFYDASVYIVQKLEPLLPFLKKWQERGGAPAINNPDTRKNFEEVQRIYTMLQEQGERIEKHMFALQQRIQDPFLREEEAVRFKKGFTQFLSSEFLDKHFPLDSDANNTKEGVHLSDKAQQWMSDPAGMAAKCREIEPDSTNFLEMQESFSEFLRAGYAAISDVNERARIARFLFDSISSDISAHLTLRVYILSTTEGRDKVERIAQLSQGTQDRMREAFPFPFDVKWMLEDIEEAYDNSQRQED